MDALVESEMEYWLRYRDRFGISGTEQRVDRIARTPQGERTIIEYSAPLTRAEEARVARRLAREDQMELAISEIEGWEGFAGAYIDQPAGGTVHVLFDRSLSNRERRTIRSFFTERRFVEFVRVDYSLAELDDVAEEIHRASASDGSQVSVSLDIRGNQLRVGAREAKLGDKARVGPKVAEAIEDSSALVDLDEDALVTSTSCTSRNNCGPEARAGVSLTLNAATSNGLCTSAFVAEDNGTGNDVLLTAGHCADPFGNGATVGTVLVGGQGPTLFYTGTNTFVNNSRTDAVAIDIDDADTSHHIYKAINQKYRPITSVKLNHGVGSTVCVGSIRFGDVFRCGEVIDQRWDGGVGTPSGGVVNLRRLAVFEIVLPVPGGDCSTASGFGTVAGASGASVFNNRKAVGILAACSGPTQLLPGGNSEWNLFYSKAHLVEFDLGVSIRTG